MKNQEIIRILIQQIEANLAAIKVALAEDDDKEVLSDILESMSKMDKETADILLNPEENILYYQDGNKIINYNDPNDVFDFDDDDDFDDESDDDDE